MAETDRDDVLLRCMAAVAGADGRVDDAELEEITGIYTELTGRPVTVQVLRSAVDAAWDGGLSASSSRRRRKRAFVGSGRGGSRST